MSTNNHTAISNGAALNASVANSPLSQLDAAISGIQGGSAVTDQQLKDWTEAGAYEMTSITWDGDQVVSGATVKWPDGSAGTFTTTSKNATWLAIDAYTISHAGSSKTVTQAAVTRDGDGNVTTKPALTVA